MKIIISLLLVSFLAGFVDAQDIQSVKDVDLKQEEKLSEATIDFESKIVDYGRLEFNADGNREFIFTNNGTDPLIIKTARGSCGCTVPSFPKEPIMPGSTGKI